MVMITLHCMCHSVSSILVKNGYVWLFLWKYMYCSCNGKTKQAYIMNDMHMYHSQRKPKTVDVATLTLIQNHY